ncbi:MAG: SufD family Fe-S cluster assembly protein [Deferribacterota bacterium]|nr:SufD family Fe-S cluster assembly protein [Deferribacterota bacterium]
MQIDLAKKYKELAQSAINKKAEYGLDIDLTSYEEVQEFEEGNDLDKMPSEIKEAALLAGVDFTEGNRSGSFMQINHSVIYKKIMESYENKIEIMSVNEALDKYPEMSQYWWQAVNVDKDKYTAYAELKPMHGYFIRVLPGVKVDKPIQACLMMQENAKVQNVHNIIIVEEGAEAQLITGCAVPPKVKEGLHIGISEFYVKKNAKLTFTMIHNWADDFHVRPRSATIVEENATFISNYVLLKPVKSVQMFPSANLIGKNAKAQFNSILYGKEGSNIDVGSKVILSGDNTSGQAISRAIVDDNSTIYARGTLISKNDSAKAHLDCRGILASKSATMYAIPELVADKAPKSNLSHEAAIGPIGEEEIEYLMSRGLSKDEAVTLITQGFLNTKILGLPKVLEKNIQKMISKTQKDTM